MAEGSNVTSGRSRAEGGAAPLVPGNRTTNIGFRALCACATSYCTQSWLCVAADEDDQRGGALKVGPEMTADGTIDALLHLLALARHLHIPKSAIAYPLIQRSVMGLVLVHVADEHRA